VRDLTRHGVLVSNLHAPSTETNALGYPLTSLDDADIAAPAAAASFMRELAWCTWSCRAATATVAEYA